MKYIFSDYEILVNVTLSKIKALDDAIILVVKFPMNLIHKFSFYLKTWLSTFNFW